MGSKKGKKKGKGGGAGSKGGSGSQVKDHTRRLREIEALCNNDTVWGTQTHSALAQLQSLLLEGGGAPRPAGTTVRAEETQEGVVQEQEHSTGSQFDEFWQWMEANGVCVCVHSVCAKNTVLCPSQHSVFLVLPRAKHVQSNDSYRSAHS